MFICLELRKPSKFKLLIPIKKVISSSELRSYYEYEYGDNWPLSSVGHYEKLEMSNIYFFVFHKAICCSYTYSDIHAELPHPVNKQESFTLPRTAANTGARSFFDFNGRAFDLLEDGSLSINDTFGTKDSRNEGERTRDAILGIQRWLATSYSNIEVSGYTKNNKKFCPFTGGGDIFFQGRITASTLIMHRESEEEDEGRTEEGDEESTEEGDEGSTAAICSIIENKVKQSNDVLLQLQANMVLASAESLRNKIRMGDLTLDEMDQCTAIHSYGVSYGQDIEFLFLRSTFNFDRQTLSFEFLFGPKYWLAAVKYVDAAIQYMVCEMTKNNQ